MFFFTLLAAGIEECEGNSKKIQNAIFVAGGEHPTAMTEHVLENRSY